MTEQNATGSMPIKAVFKTMKILECLSSDRFLGITELTDLVSPQLGQIPMDKSTMYRFLSSLIELGFVYQDPQTEKYGLTLKLFEIGIAVVERVELWREAEPIVKEIARLTDETIHLATFDDADNLVYLQKVESMKTLRVSMMSRVGHSAPAHCTGVGKVLLAHLREDQRNRILQKEKPVRYTDKTIIKRADLDREFSLIRERGYAIDNEEHELGVRCVAAPIRNNESDVCGAISISVPTVRLPDKKIPHFRDIIINSAEEISSKMGYHSPKPAFNNFIKKRSRKKR